MEDKLKKFVHENRQAFDRQQPSPLVWDRIKQDLGKHEDSEAQTSVRPMRTTRVWYAAASIAAVMLLSGIIWRQLHTGYQASQEKITATIAQKENNSNTQDLTVAEQTDTEAQSTDASIYDIDSRVASTATPQLADNKKQNNTATRNEKRTEQRTTTAVDPLEQTYALLADESSAINRLEGVLQLANRDEVSDASLTKVQALMVNDPNENVRLAAYDLYMEYAPAAQREQQIQDVFLQQKDPAMQMELMQAMAETDAMHINDATTQRLEAIVEDPLAIDLVKHQAYAVLMKNW